MGYRSGLSCLIATNLQPYSHNSSYTHLHTHTHGIHTLTLWALARKKNNQRIRDERLIIIASVCWGVCLWICVCASRHRTAAYEKWINGDSDSSRHRNKRERTKRIYRRHRRRRRRGIARARMRRKHSIKSLTICVVCCCCRRAIHRNRPREVERGREREHELCAIVHVRARTVNPT